MSRLPHSKTICKKNKKPVTTFKEFSLSHQKAKTANRRALLDDILN